MYYKNSGYKLFYAFNLLLLAVISLVCVFPLIYILALSFSSGAAAAAGRVFLWPIDFTVQAYRETLNNDNFLSAMGISVLRVVAGVALGMLVTVLAAYPLSKMDNRELMGRRWLIWYFIFPMLFSGGLIPFYILVKNLHLLNTFWVMIFPSLVAMWNIILMLNFFRAIPKELYDSSLIDGAGHFRTLFMIYLPLSMAAIATLSLFTAVGHWNSWFDGLIFLKDKSMWPLSTLLQTILVAPDPTKMLVDKDVAEAFSERTVKAAQIFIGSVPILLVYPFLQRYFVKGVVIGAVKG